MSKQEEWHPRHFLPNIQKSMEGGFGKVTKQLTGTLTEGLKTLMPLGALAADPLLAFGLEGIGKGWEGLKGLGTGKKETKNTKNENTPEAKTIEAQTGILDSGNQEIKEAIQTQNETITSMLSGSPPYLFTISDYMQNWQYPILDEIAENTKRPPKEKRGLLGTILYMKLIYDKIAEFGIISSQVDPVLLHLKKKQHPLLMNMANFLGLISSNIIGLTRMLSTTKMTEEQRAEERRKNEKLIATLEGLSVQQNFIQKAKEKEGGLLAKGGELLGGVDIGKIAAGSALGGLLLQGAKKAGGTLAKLGPAAALAAGITWMAMDGIAGWAKADDWGTSKVSGAIAGGLAGTGEGGIKNAFKQMGKWALIGAGVGSFVPIVGTIAGGLIGAAIGGILGWIGGEKIAKALDKVGEWFMNAWDNAIPFLKESWTKFTTWISGIWENITGWFKEKWTQTKELPGKAMTAVKEGWDNTTEAVGNAWDATTQPFKDAATATSNFFGDSWQKTKETTDAMKNWATERWDSALDMAKEGITNIRGKITGIWEQIDGWFTGIFNKIKETFTLDNLKKFTPLQLPRLLFELIQKLKGAVVSMIPEKILGWNAQDFAMKLLDVDPTTVFPATDPSEGQQAYTNGLANKLQWAEGQGQSPMSNANLITSNVINNASNIFTPPNSNDDYFNNMSKQAFQY